MEHRVIEPSEVLAGAGYALPGGAARSGDDAPTALPHGAGSGDEALDALHAGIAPPPSVQPAWGWGEEPARPPRAETAASALTDLPANPALYTARQQDAVRRDVGARLGNYVDYQPEPFAG